MKITDHHDIERQIARYVHRVKCVSLEIATQTNEARASSPLEFVHCDLAGPIEPAAKDRFKYALSFVDDYTGTSMIPSRRCFLRQS